MWWQNKKYWLRMTSCDLCFLVKANLNKRAFDLVGSVGAGFSLTSTAAVRDHSSSIANLQEVRVCNSDRTVGEVKSALIEIGLNVDKCLPHLFPNMVSPI